MSFVVMVSTQATYQRYLMPLVPYLAVLGARMLVTGFGAPRLAAGVALAVVLHTALFSASLVTRFDPDQQVAVAQWIRARGTRVRVEQPETLFAYAGLVPIFKDAAITPKLVALGRWLETRPDVFVLPEWIAVYLRRTPPSQEAVDALERLESGAAGYREAMRWEPSWFLHQDLYSRLDPGLRTEWYGRIGFRVYVPAPQQR